MIQRCPCKTRLKKMEDRIPQTQRVPSRLKTHHSTFAHVSYPERLTDGWNLKKKNICKGKSSDPNLHFGWIMLGGSKS